MIYSEISRWLGGLPGDQGGVENICKAYGNYVSLICTPLWAGK